ncbi:MAG: hypothetical protein ACYDCL_18750 [Myxococcales bacterium]
MARPPKGPELDEVAELPVRREARRARDARRRAEDCAHEETLSRYGRPYEQLFQTKRKAPPPRGGGG